MATTTTTGRQKETPPPPYAIDLTLFKYAGFYQMVDPDGPRVFGRNACHVINAALVAFSSAVTAVGFVCFLFAAEHTADTSLEDMALLFYIACISVGNLKVVTVIRHAGELWRSFDVAHERFLSSPHCRARRRRLGDCGARFARLFPWYYFLFVMTAFFWITLPIYKNRHGDGDDGERVAKYNVVNLVYPRVSADTYNAHYGVLYATEATMCAYGAFGLVTFDLFLIAMLQLISTQYEIVASAFEGLKSTVVDENGSKSNENFEDDLRSITLDCQKLYKRLEKIYEISRPIALIYMVGDAIGMITMPYAIVLCYVKHGSVFNSDVMTFAWTLIVIGVQSFIYCSLYQYVNEKKQAVSFGLYCSDWTWSDIRVKKQILLMMQVNNSNDLKMSVTPAKFIDLPMLATVAKASYNVTSVLINFNIKKIKHT